MLLLVVESAAAPHWREDPTLLGVVCLDNPMISIKCFMSGFPLHIGGGVRTQSVAKALDSKLTE